jgi:uncharacterized phage protein (TIGR02218 family)
MKTASAAITAHIAQQVTTLTTLARIERRDGVIKGLTSHDADIAWDDGSGSVTYVASAGYSRTAVSSSGAMEPDIVNVQGLFDSVGITEEDFLVGRMDDAKVRFHLVNWRDLSMGSVILREGTVGKVTSASDFVARLRGLLQPYVREIVELISPTCRVRKLGDGRCHIDMAGTLWTASLATAARKPADAKGEVIIRPSVFNDRWFEPTNAGLTGPSEPAWDTVLGNTTAETLTTAVWAPTTFYPAGAQILENGLIWVSDGGTSGAVEPIWTGTPADTIADNDIIWTAFAILPTVWRSIRARRIDATVASVITDMEFTVTPVTGSTDAPDTWFQAGFAVFTGGNNNGIELGIHTWALATKTIRLFLPAPFPLAVSNTLTLVAGCDRIRATCRDDFDNMINFQGEPDLRGNDWLLAAPVSPPSG